MPNKQKLEAEEKVKIVLEYLNGELGQREGARKAGVTHTTFQGWIRIFENYGIDGFQQKVKQQYSAETKKAAVRAYQKGKGSLEGICKKFKIKNSKTLREWIQVYNAHGDFNSRKESGGGSCMKKARSTTQEERLQIVKDCLESGRNYGEIAVKYNVSYQQVRTWTQRFEELGEAGLEDRRGKRKKDQTPRTELEAAQIEIEQLKHKLYLAEMENHLLKKLDEIVRRDALGK